MKKLPIIIFLFLISFTSNAQEKVEAVVIGQGVIRTQDSREIVARFYANKGGDTITIDMVQYVPVKKSLPKIAQRLGIEKDKTTILKVVEPNNTITMHVRPYKIVSKTWFACVMCRKSDLKQWPICRIQLCHQ